MIVKVEFSINTVEIEVKYFVQSFECGGNLFTYVSNPL